jgi:hypothetical protein
MLPHLSFDFGHKALERGYRAHRGFEEGEIPSAMPTIQRLVFDFFSAIWALHLKISIVVFYSGVRQAAV